MKKHIITLALALGFGMNVNAQIGQYNNAQSDGFFTMSSEETRTSDWGTMPSLFSHGMDIDQSAEPAPVGSGLLLLGGMAMLYAARKRK